MNKDSFFMQRALRLAKKGMGYRSGTGAREFRNTSYSEAFS